MSSGTTESVLITGAFGQVGRRCAEILLGRGRTVIALDLHNDRTSAVAADLASRKWPGTLVTAYVDLLDADAVAALVARHRPDAIVHLAAILAPVSYRNPRQARKVNVGGTENVVAAAVALPTPPLVVYASSAAVYGSRNPHRYPERITPDTGIEPVDQYGEDKVRAEKCLRDSGLSHAVLRLGGVMSPDSSSEMSPDHLLLMRAMPGDNRMHTVDARDVGLAFANAADRRDAVAGKVLLIGGDQSHVHTQRELEDDMMTAVGLGRLGDGASLPGDPDDDRGWGFTGWFDTTESQSILEFQQHAWPETVAWVASGLGAVRGVLRLLGPVLRPVVRLTLDVQRRIEKRGPYADPWTLIEKKYGADVLATADF